MHIASLPTSEQAGDSSVLAMPLVVPHHGHMGRTFLVSSGHKISNDCSSGRNQSGDLAVATTKAVLQPGMRPQQPIERRKLLEAPPDYVNWVAEGKVSPVGDQMGVSGCQQERWPCSFVYVPLSKSNGHCL